MAWHLGPAVVAAGYGLAASAAYRRQGDRPEDDGDEDPPANGGRCGLAVTGTALGLVLVAAVAHATWNLLAKRAGASGLAFVWCFAGVEAALVAPLALWQWSGAAGLTPVVLSPVVVAAALGSGLLHTGYFLLLQRGYARGELSLVYPVARGLGPLLAVVGAVVLLGERPPAIAYLGVLAVCGGVLWLATLGRPAQVPGVAAAAAPDRSGGGVRAGGVSPRRVAVPGLGTAVLVGGSIAAYTLWDGYAMGTLRAAPVVYFWVASVTRFTLLSVLVVWRRAPVRAAWEAHRSRVLAVGVLSPVSYVLVLIAFGLAPVSLVAPAREISIVVGTLFGVRLLGEAGAARRLAAAGTIVAGVVVLGVA